MTVGLIAPGTSVLARRLQAKLAERSRTPVPWFDSTMPEETRITLGEGSTSWDGIGLDGFDALFVHGFRYEDPVMPTAEPAVDWSLWQSGHVLQQQRYSLFYSLLSRLEADGPALYNAPSAHLAAFSRHHVLERLALAGLRVAAALCTNDPQSAESFCGERAAAGEILVWRTVTGRSAWQIFRDRQRLHLVAADKAPVLIAPVVQGPLRRSFVLDGRTVLSVGWNGPSASALERLEEFHVTGPVTDEESRLCAAALTATGLRWGSILYVAGPDGPVIYDVDADPVVTELPAALADHLIDCLAAGLTGAEPPAFEGASVQSRGSLFLRRMLRIQFDMEQTKYAE